MEPSIAEQLRAAIHDCERSLYSLAKDADTTPEQISRFLKKERDLRLETASKIAAVLGLQLVKNSDLSENSSSKES